MRSIPFIKIHILGITWVVATQLLPFTLFSTLPFTPGNSFVFIGSFLFIFSISIPFDIRDLKVDNQELKTIPQMMGAKNAKKLALVTLMLSSIMFFLVLQNFQIGIILSTITTGLIISKSGKYNNELYYSGLVDGTLILLALLGFVFQEIPQFFFGTIMVL
jgi:4-hydroxybenzoate polyprenyltransferase